MFLFYPHDAGAVEFLISNQDLCLTTLIFQITWNTLPNHPTSMLDLRKQHNDRWTDHHTIPSGRDGFLQKDMSSRFLCQERHLLMEGANIGHHNILGKRTSGVHGNLRATFCHLALRGNLESWASILRISSGSKISQTCATHKAALLVQKEKLHMAHFWHV